MANGWHNMGKLRHWHGAASEIDVINDVIVIMAYENVTGYDLDDDFVTGASEGIGRAGVTEVTSTGYDGGFEGADRLSLASRALAKTTSLAWFDCDDLTWSSISQNGSETWVAFTILDELTSDALSVTLFHIDTATGLPLTPNGSDITLTIDAVGIAQIT